MIRQINKEEKKQADHCCVAEYWVEEAKSI